MGLLSIILANRERKKAEDAIAAQNQALQGFSEGSTTLGDALGAGIDPRTLQLVQQSRNQADEAKKMRTQNAMRLLQSVADKPDQLASIRDRLSLLQDQGSIGEFTLPGDIRADTSPVGEQGPLPPDQEIPIERPTTPEEALGEIRTELALQGIGTGQGLDLSTLKGLPEEAVNFALKNNLQPGTAAYAEGYRQIQAAGGLKFDPSKLEGQALAFFKETGLNPANPANLKAYNDFLNADETLTSEEFKDVGTLQDRFEKQATVQDGRSIAAAMSRLRSVEPTAAGDLALIFNFMKIQDPGSTVREGEFANAQNAAGIDGKVRNLWNNLLEGTRLNAEQRNDFRRQAGRMAAAQLGKVRPLIEKFRTTAERRGLDPDDVVKWDEFGLKPPKTEEPVTDAPAPLPPAKKQGIISRARELAAQNPGLSPDEAVRMARQELGE